MMAFISIQNFVIEPTERGYAVLRYESTAQEFEHLDERADLKEAILLMLDEVRRQVDLDEFVEISPSVSQSQARFFTEKRLKAKLTLSVRSA